MLRWLLAHLKAHRGIVVLAALLAVVSSGAGAAWVWMVGPLMKVAVLGGATHLPAALSGEFLLHRIPWFIAGLALLRALAGWGHQVAMTSVARKVSYGARVSLFQRLTQVPLAGLEGQQSGALLAGLNADLARIELATAQLLGSAMKDGATVLSLIGVCLYLDVRLFLLAFVVVPAMVVPVNLFARRLRSVVARTQRSLNRLATLFQESWQNISVVDVHGMAPLLEARFDQEYRSYFAGMRRSLFIRGAFTPTVEFLGVIGLALCIGWGAAHLPTQPELGSKLLSFLGAALFMYQPLKSVSGTWSQLGLAADALRRIEASVSGAPPPTGVGRVRPLQKGLSLRGVTMDYPQRPGALVSVDLEIPARRMVALVGRSGAGKTTATKLLMGLLEPTTGGIFWDDADFRTLDREVLHRRMAWLPQEPLVVEGTVAENVRFGREASEADVWRALEQAQLGPFVRSLPARLQATVDEKAWNFSGGQRQRLCLARALLGEPDVLFLDEPTRALDETAEAEVSRVIEAASRERTTLIVAHRLSTVERADCIVVFDGGRIVQTGRHEELKSLAGLYAELVAHSREGHFEG